MCKNGVFFDKELLRQAAGYIFQGTLAIYLSNSKAFSPSVEHFSTIRSGLFVCCDFLRGSNRLPISSLIWSQPIFFQTHSHCQTSCLQYHHVLPFFFIVDSFAYKFDSWRNRISKQAFLNNGKRLSHFWVDRPRRICNVVCVLFEAEASGSCQGSLQG